jgi:endoglucanase
VGLEVRGNHLTTLDGKVWHGRGANLADPRGCNACTAAPPNVAEVKRRIDALVGDWKANFIRLDLEAYASADGYRDPSNYKSVLADSAYGMQIRELVQYIGTKPGVYVLVSVWDDPSIGALGWPTLDSSMGTDATWTRLVQLLGDQPQVLFGVINEPEMNYNGAQDADVWSRMNSVVKAIRDAEDAAHVPYHVVTVQGTGGWARRLDYYVTHPIAEREGKNVAYETHVYDPQSNFASMFEQPAATLPVIIGEFGPGGGMTLDDCDALMTRAQTLEIPHLAWTFHMRCAPNLLVDNSSGGCGVNMPLAPPTWGERFKARLATPW